MKILFSISVVIIILLILISSFWTHRDNLLRFLLLFLFPERFIDLSTKDTISRELKTNTGFKERYESNDLKWKEERLQSYHKQFSEASQSLKNSIYQALLTALKVTIVAGGLAYLFARYISPNVLNIIQIVSTFVIFIAVIGKMGWSIQTISGETLPEVVNEFWSILLNWVGILCFFFTQFCPFFKK